MTGTQVQRRLAAILAADVVGFSTLMERDEEGTHARIGSLRREVIEPHLSEHLGRLIKTTGDGFLAEFASPIAALRCALAVQSRLANDPDAVRLRIGLNLGDVMVEEGGDVYGEGVNVAARLEALAEPGGILISGKIFSEVEGKVEAYFEDRGEQQVKNITRLVRIYTVHPARTVSSLSSTTTVLDHTKALQLPDKPSIAVLPFQNMSGDPEQDYFADGMVEDIITGLSRSKSLFVIARNSTFTYKGRAVDIKKVGRELGVRYVLEGSVRKAGDRVRITGQLIDASTGNHIWADRYDSTLHDIFDLQDRVTTSVIGALAPQVERAEILRAKREPTESLQAYDYYLRGLASTYRRTREANIEALSLAQTAAKIDPDFALAYALGAQTFNQKKAFGWITDLAQDAAHAQQLARRAIELDKDDPTVLAMAGQTLAFVAEEVEEGAAILDRAISLDPNLAAARVWSGWSRLYLDEIEAAIEQFQIGLRLSPLDPRIFLAQTGMACAQFLAGRYEEGSSWAKIIMQQHPNFLGAHRITVACHAMAGRVQEARQACAVALAMDPTQRISDIKSRTPYRKPSVEKFAEAFRIAGMPE